MVLDDDRKRALLRSPLRQILRRSAQMGARPDRAELGELEIPDHLRDAVREAADIVAQIAESGGLRSRHKAAAQAERLAESILTEVPRQYGDSLPAADRHGDNLDPATLAEAIQRRQREHESSATDLDDLDAEREALAAVRQARRAE